MGKIALAIYNLHKDKDTEYILTREAKHKLFGIIKKFNENYNRKYLRKYK